MSNSRPQLWCKNHFCSLKTKEVIKYFLTKNILSMTPCLVNASPHCALWSPQTQRWICNDGAFCVIHRFYVENACSVHMYMQTLNKIVEVLANWQLSFIVFVKHFLASSTTPKLLSVRWKKNSEDYIQLSTHQWLHNIWTSPKIWMKKGENSEFLQK